MKPLEGRKVLIVCHNLKTTKILEKCFVNCGCEVFVESNGQAAVKSLKSLGPDLVLFTDDVVVGRATWFGHQVRGKRSAAVDVLWYIGDEAVPHFDGYTSRPFKPMAELIKPIFYNFKVIEDLREAG